MRGYGGAVACLAASVLVCSCASEGDTGSGVGGSSGGGTVADHLAALPAYDGDEAVVVTYGDLARAAEIAGLERPTDVGDTDAIADYVLDLTGRRREEGGPEPSVAALLPSVAQPDRVAELEGFVADVGWSVLDIDSYAERDTPPQQVSVLEGDFDRGALEDALDDAGDGVLIAGDPSGEYRIDDVTPARPIGQTLWHALDGGRLVVTSDGDDVAATREADGGDGTLAEDARLAPLAAALDAQDAYSAMLLADDALLTDFADVILGADSPAEAREQLEDLPRCEGVNGAAVGVAHDGEPLIVVALSFVNEQAAESGAGVVEDVLTGGEDFMTRRPWSEMLTVESVEADGSVVVVTARPADLVLGQWQGFLLNRSLPPC
jgi:hypothetical protein